MEFIKLKNGSRYQLITDGFNVGDNHVKLAFIADRSLKEIHSEFSKKGKCCDIMCRNRNR